MLRPISVQIRHCDNQCWVLAHLKMWISVSVFLQWKGHSVLLGLIDQSTDWPPQLHFRLQNLTLLSLSSTDSHCLPPYHSPEEIQLSVCQAVLKTVTDSMFLVSLFTVACSFWDGASRSTRMHTLSKIKGHQNTYSTSWRRCLQQYSWQSIQGSRDVIHKLKKQHYRGKWRQPHSGNH